MELGGDPCYEGSVDCAAVNCFSFALLPLLCERERATGAVSANQCREICRFQISRHGWIELDLVKTVWDWSGIGRGYVLCPVAVPALSAE